MDITSGNATLPNVTYVGEPSKERIAQYRRVNGADVPSIVISALASIYCCGAYPIHWEDDAQAYVMETRFFHYEITASSTKATMRVWPNNVMLDYKRAKPTSTRYFAFVRKAV